ncbi:MAG: PEP-CTERM sorting domain-containing protein [Fimbriimonadia bacterium]|jgi:hypothetical protein
MKHVAFLAMLCVCFPSPSRAQDPTVPVLGGPLVYAAGYIDQTLPVASFELNYVLDISPAASFASYSESWAWESEFVASGPNQDVTHRYASLPDSFYTATPTSLTEWEATPWAGWTYLGSMGPLRWMQPSSTQIDIDLGLGDGVNFTYINTLGSDWIGNGTFTIAGTPWLVEGTVRAMTIDVRIGRLAFTPVPEPSMLLAIGSGVLLIACRLRRG